MDNHAKHTDIPMADESIYKTGDRRQGVKNP